MMSESAELLDHLLEAVGTVACSAQSPSHRAAAHQAMGEALQILRSAPIAPLNGVHPNTSLNPLNSKEAGTSALSRACPSNPLRKSTKSRRRLERENHLVGMRQQTNMSVAVATTQTLLSTKISAEATEFMQPSIALSLNQHLELEQSRRHLDGIDDLQRLKDMAKEFLLNWQLERAESKRIIQEELGHQPPSI